MTTIEIYDSANLQDKLLIWNYNGDSYETFRVTNSRPGGETMSIRGSILLFGRQQDWFNKVRADIPNLYIMKEMLKEC